MTWIFVQLRGGVGICIILRPTPIIGWHILFSCRPTGFIGCIQLRIWSTFVVLCRLKLEFLSLIVFVCCMSTNQVAPRCICTIFNPRINCVTSLPSYDQYWRGFLLSGSSTVLIAVGTGYGWEFSTGKFKLSLRHGFSDWFSNDF